MQQQFTKEYLVDNCGCYAKEQGKIQELMKPYNEPITLEQIFTSDIPLKDKYWFLCKKLATKEENQQIIITVAEMTIPIFEKRYPEDKRPREAIDAVKQYIAGHITLDKLIEKRKAATDAAMNAAYAINAAYVYADAVYDMNAAYAINAAYADTDIKKQLENYLFTFIKSNHNANS